MAELRNEPTAETSRKRPLILALVVTLASALVIAVSYAVMLFRHDEQRLDAFCRNVRPGASFEIIRLGTAQAGLEIGQGSAASDAGKVFYISHKNPFLQAGSFCSVYTDGQVVTSVSYNPWYH